MLILWHAISKCECNQVEKVHQVSNKGKGISREAPPLPAVTGQPPAPNRQSEHPQLASNHLLRHIPRHATPKHYKVDFAHLSLAYPTACTPPCSGPNHSFPHTYPPPPCTSILLALACQKTPSSAGNCLSLSSSSSCNVIVILVVQPFAAGEHWLLQPHVLVPYVQQPDLEPIAPDKCHKLVGIRRNRLLVEKHQQPIKPLGSKGMALRVQMQQYGFFASCTRPTRRLPCMIGQSHVPVDCDFG